MIQATLLSHDVARAQRPPTANSVMLVSMYAAPPGLTKSWTVLANARSSMQ